VASRADFSATRSPAERNSLSKRKEFFYGNKGFYGTSLPLISDIRKSEVSVGIVGALLEAYGVKRKFERTVTLHAGPNRKSNRYLVHEYNRLIKAMNGTPIKGDINIQAHVV
jgi:hypothetical protein